MDKETRTRWVGLLFIKNKRVLMVREKNKDFFVLPGGKIDPGESKEAALEREIKEELNAELTNQKVFKEYSLPGREKEKRGLMEFTVFTADFIENNYSLGDIEAMEFVNTNYEEEGVKIGNITSMKLFPELKQQGLID